MAIIFEYIIIGYEFFVVECNVALSVGVAWLIISTTKELKRCLHKINGKTRANAIKPNELKLLFTEFIHAHATTKQLSIFQPVNG